MVDDNVDAAQMVAMLLQVLGDEVTVEYDPLQALASARETAFDAFILDIGLPGMDGHELARQIRALPSARGALFIALTGYGQEQDREDSKAEAGGCRRPLGRFVERRAGVESLSSNGHPGSLHLRC